MNLNFLKIGTKHFLYRDSKAPAKLPAVELINKKREALSKIRAVLSCTSEIFTTKQDMVKFSAGTVHSLPDKEVERIFADLKKMWAEIDHSYHAIR